MLQNSPLGRALAVIVLGSAALVPVTRQSAEIFEGKTITIVVPSGSGGTFHVYGQLVQRHIGKFIPGAPKTIVQNRPGAGGGKAAAYMMQAAPKDGTVVAELAPGTLTEPMMRPQKFDATKFEYLGSTAARTYVFAVWHTTPVNSIDDLKKTSVIFGNTGKTSSGYIFPHFANTALGTKIKIVSGYKGGGAINVAIERGEVQGRANFYSGFTGVRPHWFTENKIKILLALGPTRPEVANVPHIRDLIKDPEYRAMYDLLELNLNIGQAFYVPQGTPADRVAILRTAFEKIVKDPGFLADAQKRRVPITPRTAAEIAEQIAIAKAAPKARYDRLARIIGLKK